MKFRNSPRIEIKRDNFRQFLDSERPGRHSDAEEESLGRFPLCLFDFLQSPLICSIERLRQHVQSVLDIPWEAVGEVCKLTMNPSEPIGCMGEMGETDAV